MSDPTQRFTSRVADYVRTRPGYPAALFDRLAQEAKLGPNASIADIGAGTGISAQSLLETGSTVYAVEPNATMRKAAEESFAGRTGFVSVAGTSEATTLPDGAIDLVTAFQAFHWFDRAAARREFVRILKPKGLAALVWNDRDEEATPFLRGYEALLREYGNDYLAVRHNAIQPDDLQAWFGGTMKTARYRNAQTFDFEGVLGRLASSSYAPDRDDPKHGPMVDALRRLFEDTAENGTVEFLYETSLFYGPLDEA